jgi:hypothetical protein
VLDAMLTDLKAEKKAIEEARKQKDAANALGSDLAIVIKETGNKLSYTVREVVNGKIGEMNCTDLDVLAKYLARAYNDPQGPKSLRISAARDSSHERVRRVFEVSAAAGYKKASFTANLPAWTERSIPSVTYQTIQPLHTPTIVRSITAKTTVIDLTKYAPGKR